MAIRLAHFSDIHVTTAPLHWTWGDWFSKRLTSWLNHAIGRGPQFALADEIVRCLMDDLVQRGIDHVVFSGDATALGFEEEVRHAAGLLRVDTLPIPGLAVPGNHDYCTWAAAESGAFERHFAPWQQGRRIGDFAYPFAQAIGDAWLIGVNGATGNRWSWDAGGAVAPDQLDRLRQLLDSLPTGIKILVVHFPVCLAGGGFEWYCRGLRNLDEIVAIAQAGGVNLWLHGHRHTPYYHQSPNGAPFPVICAGTATQRDLWSYGEYVIDGARLLATRRQYDPETKAFHNVESFELILATIN